MNIVKETVLSFYSRNFYFRLARESGIGMRFILMLTLISTLLLAGALIWADIHFHYLLDRVPEWTNTLPAVTHKNGKIAIDKPVPYYIQFGRTGEAGWIVIDTNYKIENLDTLSKFMQQNKIICLVTENKFITFKDVDYEPRIKIDDIDSNQDFSISHDDWKHYANVLATSGIPIFIVSTVICFAIGMFIANLILTFFNALAVLVLGLIMSAALDLSAAMRLAAAYRIPVILISYLGYVVSIIGLYSTAFGWLIWLGYLVFAVWSARPQVIKPAA